MRRYHHIDKTQRRTIAEKIAAGVSHEEIARHINRHVSSIRRELARNGRQRGYDAEAADVRAVRRRCERPLRRKMDVVPLRRYVAGRLIGRKWSPGCIAGTLRKNRAGCPRWYVGRMTLYRYIRRERLAGRDAWARALPQSHRKWRRRGGQSRFQRLRDIRPISQRPKIVERRWRVGDWEGDTIRDAHGAMIVTLVERRTGFLVAARVNGRGARACNRAILRALATQARGWPVHTITFDRGMEFSCHRELERALKKTKIYFADPHAAWQRPVNENTNGLLRRYFPKKRDLATVTKKEIDHALHQMNSRPRQRHDFLSPRRVAWRLRRR